MSSSNRSGVIHLAAARTSIPGPANEHAVSVWRRGNVNVMLSLGRFVPPGPRPVSAHDQDEVYVIVSGRGVLLHGGERTAFEAGDLLHVAAGVDHRFEDFTDDLVVWVIFYGPRGGEMPD